MFNIHCIVMSIDIIRKSELEVDIDVVSDIKVVRCLGDKPLE